MYHERNLKKLETSDEEPTTSSRSFESLGAADLKSSLGIRRLSSLVNNRFRKIAQLNGALCDTIQFSNIYHHFF